MSSGTQFSYFAACAPGLEALLAEEIAALGVPGSSVAGGVQGRTSHAGLWSLHLDSALAESVRVRLKSFNARSFAELEAGLGRLPWHAFLWREQAIDVRVTCHESKLYHSDAVAERVRRVIAAQLARGRQAPQQPAVARVFVRLSKDCVTPSIDSSGERLHQRGYRTHVERAPLRETLAAAMVRSLDSLAQQHGKTVERVWDPFCGSGVLPLEWLRRERGVPPGAERSFAFEAWPTHPHDDYAHYRQQRVPGPRAPGDVHALGSDIDAKAIRSAVHNAEQSGLPAHTTFWQADFREAVERIPEGTALLANPPYGKRIGSRTAARQRFVDLLGVLDARPDLRPVVLACPDPDWLPNKGWQLLVETRHGGVPLSFLGLASGR